MDEVEAARQEGLYRGPALSTKGMKLRRWKLPGPKITRRRLEEAIRGSLGVVARVARRLAVTTDAVRRRLRRPENADLLHLLQAERESIVDDAEDTVAECVRQRDDPNLAFRASRFVLDARGRDRGWKREVTLSGGADPLRVDVGGPALDVASLALPLAVRRALLEAAESQSAPQPEKEKKR